MAFAADANNTGTRAYSIGPVKQLQVSGTVATGDTTFTYTAAPLAEVRFAMLTGVVQTAAPTYSGNTVTFTFTASGITAAYVQFMIHGV